MRKILYTFCLLVINLSKLLGQDIQYSQYYANPIYLNPGLTGSTGMNRFGFNFRNQWPGLDQTFVAYSGYYDFYVPEINSSIGIIIQGAQESFTNTAINDLGLVYAYRLKIDENQFLQFGIQGSFISRDAKFDEVVLGTQLDIDRGVIIGNPGDGFVGDSQIRSADAHAGLMYFGKRIWLGASAFHLLRPKISYLAESNENLPIRMGFHGGYRFFLPSGEINDYFNNRYQERSVVIGFNYKQQGEFTQLDLGAEFFFEPLVLGFWYRGLPTKYELPNNESLVSLIGISLSSGIEIGYSFDFPISQFNIGSSGGAHELSLRYVFLPSGKVKKDYPSLPTFRY